MGRTDQVLTGGSLSYDHNMKAVLALLLVCLVQISFAEQDDIAADSVSSVANLLLQREVREAAKGKNKECDKECRKKQRQKKKNNRKRLRKQQKKGNKDRKKNRTSKKAKKSKNGGGKGGKSGKN